jgi:hypothetical protein
MVTKIFISILIYLNLIVKITIDVIRYLVVSCYNIILLSFRPGRFAIEIIRYHNIYINNANIIKIKIDIIIEYIEKSNKLYERLFQTIIRIF